jgi:hypothetical protein
MRNFSTYFAAIARCGTDHFSNDAQSRLTDDSPEADLYMEPLRRSLIGPPGAKGAAQKYANFGPLTRVPHKPLR